MPEPKRIVFKRRGTPDIEEPKAKIGKPPNVAISALEQTILAQNGGALDVLEVPEVHPPETEAIEIQAQKLAQVENLMFQGVRSPHLIAQATGISEALTAKYVKAVLARWQVLGGEVDMKAQRGEALGYMDYLTKELWTQYQQAKQIVTEQMKLPLNRPEGDNGPKRDLRAIGAAQSRMLNLNNQIIALNTQRHQLYGLTPQAINNMLIIGGNEDHEVLVRMRKQQGMKEVLGKLGAILMRNRQIKQLPPTHDV